MGDLFPEEDAKVEKLIDDILRSWKNGRNVLLYGPPATGKTRLISSLYRALKEKSESSKGILLDTSSEDLPFKRPDRELPIPTPIRVEWTTFHQSYGYEDFIIGLRPEVTRAGTELVPWAGILLDAAIELTDENSGHQSVVIFIDEINRGNAARIFGEFMTFLDFDYREGGTLPLPLPLRHLAYSDSASQEIRRLDGEKVRIPREMYFPKNVYIVATMNSVDRAAVPIDSALARRFDRIEMSPDPQVLLEMWGLTKTDVPNSNFDDADKFDAHITAYLLLDRLNLAISQDLGPEFELGHGLFVSMPRPQAPGASEDESWRQLAEIWDEVILPQLEDRYAGRPEHLAKLLRVDDSPAGKEYAWRFRKSYGGTVTSRALENARISEHPIETIKNSLRWLVL